MVAQESLAALATLAIPERVVTPGILVMREVLVRVRLEGKVVQQL